MTTKQQRARDESIGIDARLALLALPDGSAARRPLLAILIRLDQATIEELAEYHQES